MNKTKQIEIVKNEIDNALNAISTLWGDVDLEQLFENDFDEINEIHTTLINKLNRFNELTDELN